MLIDDKLNILFKLKIIIVVIRYKLTFILLLNIINDKWIYLIKINIGIIFYKSKIIKKLLMIFIISCKNSIVYIKSKIGIK